MRTITRELPEISIKLREARKKCGITQQQMAEQFGIPKRTVEDWEQGKHFPPMWAYNLVIEKLENMSKRVDLNPTLSSRQPK